MPCERLYAPDGHLVGHLCEPTVRTHHDGRRLWRWTDGPATGPLLVNRHGEPLDRQPGPRSRFWEVYERATGTEPAPTTLHAG